MINGFHITGCTVDLIRNVFNKFAYAFAVYDKILHLTYKRNIHTFHNRFGGVMVSVSSIPGWFKAPSINEKGQRLVGSGSG